MRFIATTFFFLLFLNTYFVWGNTNANSQGQITNKTNAVSTNPTNIHAAQTLTKIAPTTTISGAQNLVSHLTQFTNIGSINVQARISSNKILLGKPFTYTLQITYPKNSPPLLPAPVYDFSPLELVDHKIFPISTLKNGSSTFTIEYSLVTFSLKTQNTPAFYLQLNNSQQINEVVKPFFLEVLQQVVANEVSSKIMKPYEEAVLYKNKLTWKQTLSLTLIIMLCTAIVVLIIILLKTPRNRIFNAYENLENKLQRLKMEIEISKNIKMTQDNRKQEVRSIFFKLSEYAKEFLALRCNDKSAVGATLQELKTNSVLFFINQKDEDAFINFFHSGEKIKFSKSTVDIKKTADEAEGFLLFLLKLTINNKVLEMHKRKKNFFGKKHKMA